MFGHCYGTPRQPIDDAIAAGPEVFEQTLRRVVPVRTVQLREPGSRWGRRPEGASSPESVALEVPGADPGAVGVLEATFDPGCRLGEWEASRLARKARRQAPQNG